MGELAQILNCDVATPPRAARVRRLVCIGGVYVLTGGIVLTVERVRCGDVDRIELAFALGAATARTSHHQRFRIDGLTVTPRAVLHSSAGRPCAVLLEFGGDPAAFHHAIEVAA